MPSMTSPIPTSAIPASPTSATPSPVTGSKYGPYDGPVRKCAHPFRAAGLLGGVTTEPNESSAFLFAPHSTPGPDV
eukprot:6620505-Prorocentrum_lima.AAC.1